MCNGNYKRSNLGEMALITCIGFKEFKLDHVTVVAVDRQKELLGKAHMYSLAPTCVKGLQWLTRLDGKERRQKAQSCPQCDTY